MKGYLIVVALIVLVVAVVFLTPPARLSDDAVLKLAESTPEVQYFFSLYPSAKSNKIEVDERGCVPAFFEKYVKDVSMPLAARTVPACSEVDKNKVVSYSATGIIDTSAVYVGVDVKGGKVIDAGFISPYDDIYVLNYSFVTTAAVLQSVFDKANITMVDGWSLFTENDTTYHVFAWSYGNWTALAIYIEKTSGYDVPTIDTLRPEISAAHVKFEAGSEKLKEMMRNGFLGDLNFTTYYLYYPEPATPA